MTFRLLTLDDIDPNWRGGRWKVGAALGTPGGMTVPVSRIFVHHSVSADTGDVVKDVSGPCDTDQHNFGKVSYSWNIHESTNSVIEVEGTHRGAHTINNAQQSLNGISFGFGVIGNFHPSAPNPPPRQPSDALLHLIADAIRELVVKPGYAAPGFTIEGHRDAPYATACCGDSLYAKLPIIRALVSSPPAPQEDVDMTPAHATDKQGRLWEFVVGDTRECFAYIDGQLDPQALGGIWTGGLDAFAEGGLLVVSGRGNDGALWHLSFDPADAHNTVKVKALGGHIFPPA